MKTAEPVREFHVLNLGAGVQSTTLYLMAIKGEGPKYDAAIFADTQEEPAEVYAHLEWLKTLGGPEIIIRTIGSLGDNLMVGRNSTGGRFASIPAFTTKDGGKTVGMTRRQCTKEYKTEVIERSVRRDVLGLKERQRVPQGVFVHSYVGISVDEKSRASRIYERFIDKKRWDVGFPLLDRMFARIDCIEWLARFGDVPHQVPRSACVFCPFHDDREWIHVKEDEASWKRVVQIDRALRTTGTVANRDMNQEMFLHKSCIPIEDVVFNDREAQPMQRGFALECEGGCGV